MTNVQLYLAIGMPTGAILVGIVLNVVQINAINARLSAMETRINNLEARMDHRFDNVDAGFNSMDARFNNLEVIFDTLIGKVLELGNRVTRIEAKLDLR
jgi:hypothetical protein